MPDTYSETNVTAVQERSSRRKIGEALLSAVLIVLAFLAGRHLFPDLPAQESKLTAEIKSPPNPVLPEISVSSPATKPAEKKADEFCGSFEVPKNYSLSVFAYDAYGNGYPNAFYQVGNRTGADKAPHPYWLYAGTTIQVPCEIVINGEKRYVREKFLARINASTLQLAPRRHPKVVAHIEPFLVTEPETQAVELNVQLAETEIAREPASEPIQIQTELEPSHTFELARFPVEITPTANLPVLTPSDPNLLPRQKIPYYTWLYGSQLGKTDIPSDDYQGIFVDGRVAQDPKRSCSIHPESSCKPDEWLHAERTIVHATKDQFGTVTFVALISRLPSEDGDSDLIINFNGQALELRSGILLGQGKRFDESPPERGPSRLSGSAYVMLERAFPKRINPVKKFLVKQILPLAIQNGIAFVRGGPQGLIAVNASRGVGGMRHLLAKKIKFLRPKDASGPAVQ